MQDYWTFTSCMRTKHTRVTKHRSILGFGSKGYLGYLHVLCTNLLDSHICCTPWSYSFVVCCEDVDELCLDTTLPIRRCASCTGAVLLITIVPLWWIMLKNLWIFINMFQLYQTSGQVPGISWLLFGAATIETRQSRSWYLQGSTPWHLPLEMRRIALGGQNRQKRASWTGWTGWTGWNNRNR